ncbi:MAG: alpha/beta fold hydrolase [Akkermansiaceae bacterium]|nr:alpha/beta fold hydrolase [Akkermansiaceae bacterium]
MIPPLPWHRPRLRPSPGDRVVLLHGLWRSVWAMDGLASTLNDEGFETLNIPYASFRKTLDEIVDDVADVIGSSRRRTHFVTHSMGGIVLRCLALRHPGLVTGKIVMLAPPNQGSEIIDWLEDSPLGRWSLGPGGMSLSTKTIREKIPGFSDQHDVSVIMGRNCSIPFFQSFFKGENDGIVTVEGGKVAGMGKMEVVDGDHTFLMSEPVVREKVLNLLEA